MKRSGDLRRCVAYSQRADLAWRIRDIEPIRVRLMRDGEFAGLPAIAQLVHIRVGSRSRDLNGAQPACEPALSANLIKPSRAG